MVFALALLGACSKDNPVDSENRDVPAVMELVVTPASGVPGTPIALSGVTLDTSALGAYTVFFGSTQSLLMSNAQGGASTFAPLLLDTAIGWHAPSGEPLDVAVFRNDTLIALAKRAFTVDNLPKSPGATLSYITETKRFVTAFQSMIDSMPATDIYEKGLIFAISSVLDTMLYGDDSSSLSFGELDSILSLSPGMLELSDALYGASGAVENMRLTADAMESLVAVIPGGDSAAFARSSSRPQILSDRQLAWRMQVAATLKQFTADVIAGGAGTASSINSFISRLSTFKIYKIVDKVFPPLKAATTTAEYSEIVLNLLNLILNKMIVSTLPTVIDSMTVTFEKDAIGLHEDAVADLKIYASNLPDSVTAGELIDQFLAIAGLFVPEARTKRDKLLRKIQGFVNKVKSKLSEFSKSHPAFTFDTDITNLGLIPIRQWYANIRRAQFIDRKTSTPALLEVVPDTVIWRSKNRYGEGKVRIEPTRNPDGIFITAGFPFYYNGTSFGSLDGGVASSEDVSIQIREVALETNFATTISPEGSNALEVKAGHYDINGNPVWEPGLSVDLFVIGGGADPSSGVTDIDGQFISLVSLNPFTDSVEVIVTVTDEFGAKALDTVYARVTTGKIFAIENHYENGSKVAQLWSMNPDGSGLAVVRSLPENIQYSGLYGSPDNNWMISEASTSYYTAFMLISRNGLYRVVADYFRTTDAYLNVAKQMWAPEGAEFVFSGREGRFDSTHGVFTYNAATGQLADLRAHSRNVKYTTHLWSPLGDKFFVTKAEDNSGTNNWTYSLGTLNADGTGFTPVNVPYTTTGTPMFWTPDGQRVIFFNIYDIPGTITEYNLGSGMSRTVYTSGTNLNRMDMSPDGSTLLIAEGGRGGTIPAYSMIDIASGIQSAIPGFTSVNRVIEMSFAPNGDYVLFAERPAPSTSIVNKIDLSTGSRTEIATLSGALTGLVWLGESR